MDSHLSGSSTGGRYFNCSFQGTAEDFIFSCSRRSSDGDYVRFDLAKGDRVSVLPSHPAKKAKIGRSGILSGFVKSGEQIGRIVIVTFDDSGKSGRARICDLVPEARFDSLYKQREEEIASSASQQTQQTA